MKPFVKWAGGKTRLLKDIEQRLPADFSNLEDVTYLEPFVGGGSVLFHMLQSHKNITRAVINDINQVLMATYKLIKENPEELHRAVCLLEREYNSLNSIDAKSEFYYRTRITYNNMAVVTNMTIALFVFLNHTCFNGLYRENIKGLFNVPHGKYEKVSICDMTNLAQIHAALQKVEILCGDFSHVFENINAYPNIFIYVDPPYRPVGKNTTMFTQYDKSGFGDQDQLRLKEFCDVLRHNDCRIMISNSDSYVDEVSYFENLYQGYNIDRIEVTRMINPYNSKNRRPKEVIITSYPIPRFNNPQLPIL